MSSVHEPTALQAMFREANRLSDEFDERVHKSDRWQAWLAGSRDLRHAREMFLEVSRAPQLAAKSRAASLMNAANALDEVGRRFDALDLYEDAIRLQPGDGMIHGNRAIVLVRLADGAGAAHDSMIRQAIVDLRYATTAEHADVGAAGHVHSRDRFAMWLARISGHTLRSQGESAEDDYVDPYALWAYDNRLLLWPSLSHKPPEDNLDPALVSGVVTGIESFSANGFAVPAIFSATNAIKRDYLTARFIAYQALARPSELRLGARSRSARYVDTLDYARWDLSAGLLAQAYAIAVNLADKIATALAMWLGLPTDFVNDRNWAFAPPAKAKGPKTGPAMCGPVRPALAAILAAHPNETPPLLGLVDLAQETFENPRRQAVREQRNAAVHSFLSVRRMGVGSSSSLVQGVDEGDLESDLLDALRQVRRMFLQTTLAVRHFGRVSSGAANMPMFDYEDPTTREQP